MDWVGIAHILREGLRDVALSLKSLDFSAAIIRSVKGVSGRRHNDLHFCCNEHARGADELNRRALAKETTRVDRKPPIMLVARKSVSGRRQKWKCI